MIPKSVIEIQSYAFKGCTKLTSLTIPESVTAIGSNAFCNCTGLETAIIGNSVDKINTGTFMGCSKLSSVTIGNGVYDIYDQAFAGCNELSKIYSLNTIPPVIAAATTFATYNADVYAPKDGILRYQYGTYWNRFRSYHAISTATGDIDGDGEINVGDVTALINKLLNAASYDDAVCDINGDGEVNVTDVTSLINMILE